MNKKELIGAIVEALRENSIKKCVSIPKHNFYISDDEGNTKTFSIKKTDKAVAYTTSDITDIIDTCLYVIEESLKRGEPVSIHGFGSLELSYRRPRTVKDITTGNNIVLKGKYLPKFSSGRSLRNCASIYEDTLSNKFGEESLFDEPESSYENIDDLPEEYRNNLEEFDELNNELDFDEESEE